MDELALRAAALDQAGDAIIVIDAAGIIRVWNAHAEKLFGWTAAQTIGQDVKIMIPQRLRSSHDPGFFAAMEAGHLHSDGEPRHTKGIDPDGNSVHVTMSFAVITDADARAIGSVAVAREWVREDRAAS